MTTRLNSIFVACVVSAALVACGGGGSDSAPPPAAAPAPPPPAPTSIDSSKVALAQLPASACNTSLGCILFTNLHIDSTGEATAVWSELPSGGTSRLAAANVAVGGTAPLSTGTIESNFAEPFLREFVSRPLGNRRFSILHQYGAIAIPNRESSRARIVDMMVSGIPIVFPQVVLPRLALSDNLPPVVQDSVRQQYALVDTVVPPVIALGGGANLNNVPDIHRQQFSVVEYALVADNEGSSSALYAVRGRLAPADERHMYVGEFRLNDGMVATGPLRVSTQPVTASSSAPFCEAVAPRLQSAGAAGSYVLAWSQKSASGSHCELWVNGQRVSAGTLGVTSFAVSAQGGNIVAVWEERDATPNSPRVLWSRRDATSGSWSAPVPVAPQFSPASLDQQLLSSAAGPAGTLAIVWSAVGQPAGAALVSKYVAGTWTTVQGPRSVSNIRALAVNEAGQAVALFRNSLCGTTSCEELGLYRF